MRILYVCTGNQCRSVMAEYLTRAALVRRGGGNEAGVEPIEIRSAGTLQYPPHPADPIVVELLAADGIDATAHRSTPLNADVSRAADLIMCFEREQIADLLAQNPLAARRTFLFDDFVNVCAKLRRDAGAGAVPGGSAVPGNTMADRLREAMASASMLRPFLPEARETEDPHAKPRDVFERVYAEITRGVDTILDATLEAAA